ncbi:hypothetical protein DICA0_B03950 [Diutina catenulata]
MTTLVTRNHFSRRVSFNNIHPELDEVPVGPIYNLPAPNKPTGLSAGGSGIEFNQQMFEASAFSKFATKSSVPASQPLPSRRKRLKLPDPPSKSILKNKVSPEQLAVNETTINFHGDIDDIINFTSHNQAAGGEALPTPRRKSYAEMTDEELMSLDPQFNTPKSSNVEKYKFDNQYTYFMGGSRRSQLAVPPPHKGQYASSSEHNYKSVSLTVKHNEFESTTSTRTLLAYISGRRHLWNTLDWLFATKGEVSNDTTFLQDGDYLVVAALVPRKFIADYAKISKKTAMETVLYERCNRILEYLLDSPLLTQRNLRIKITVELILDNMMDNSSTPHARVKEGNKFALDNLFWQYHPGLLLLGTKSANFNFRYPTQRKASARDEYLVKITSYVMKYSSVPVILVGPGSRWHNESGHHRRSSLKFDVDEIRPAVSKKLMPSSSRSSIASSESLDSVESFQGDQQQPTSERLGEILFSGEKGRFADMLRLISDRSLADSNTYLHNVNSQDPSLKVDSRIHQMYRSQTHSSSAYGNGIGLSKSHSASGDSDAGCVSGVYKVKSLLADPESKPKKEERHLSLPSTTMTPAEMKKRSNSIASASSGEKESKKKGFWKKLGLKK